MAAFKRVEVDAEVTARYIRSFDDLGETVSMEAVFGNRRPVEIEVGFGKGLFLLTAAAANPEVNYFGIETSKKCALLSAHRLSRAGLENVVLLVADARWVFAHLLGTSAAHAVHVYFPDPWWKRRQKKRRLFTSEFVRDVQRVLREGGCLHVWTDVESYFQTIHQIVDQHTDLAAVPPAPERQPTHDMDYCTHFERKMRQAGRTIFRGYYRKNPRFARRRASEPSWTVSALPRLADG